jgi:hypothetical protein
MAFSIWEYLRARTRDAVLAGMHDALDIAEQGDTNGSQHLAAKQLASRLNATEARGLPEPSQNGSESRGEAVPQSSPLEAPRRPTEPAKFDDELERRIDAAASQGAEEKPTVAVPPGRITNRKRGRPPKSKQEGN